MIEDTIKGTMAGGVLHLLHANGDGLSQCSQPALGPWAASRRSLAAMRTVTAVACRCLGGKVTSWSCMASHWLCCSTSDSSVASTTHTAASQLPEPAHERCIPTLQRRQTSYKLVRQSGMIRQESYLLDEKDAPVDKQACKGRLAAAAVLLPQKHGSRGRLHPLGRLLGCHERIMAAPGGYYHSCYPHCTHHSVVVCMHARWTCSAYAPAPVAVASNSAAQGVPGQTSKHARIWIGWPKRMTKGNIAARLSAMTCADSCREVNPNLGACG